MPAHRYEPVGRTALTEAADHRDLEVTRPVAADESPTVAILESWRDRVMANEPTVRLPCGYGDEVTRDLQARSRAAWLVENTARRFGLSPR